MLLTKKLACPSCNVKLRVADSLTVGKMIRCPKCGEGFPVPPAADATPPPKAKTQPRKAAPRLEEDADLDEEVVKRPLTRKRSKKARSEANNGPLVLGLVIGGGLALAAGVIIALVIRPWEKKPDQIAQTPSSGPVAMQPRPGPGPAQAESAPVEGRMDSRALPSPPAEAGPPPFAQPPVSVLKPSVQSPAGSDSDLIAAGQNVFQANRCGRCHGVGGSPGGGRRGSRGPDLARVGAVRSVDWLIEQIRDPQSHKPDSRMPPSPRIGAEDLRALATYLASLK